MVTMVKRKRMPGLSDGIEDNQALNESANNGKSKAFQDSGSVRIKGGTIGKDSNKVKAEASIMSRLGANPSACKTVKEDTKPVRNKVIVGVDYGTTYSGISFVMSVNTDARDVQVIADWAGGVRKNEQLEKVPSKYAYAVENEGLTEDKWGYEVESYMTSYSWTKLLLDKNASETEFDNPYLQAQVDFGLMRLPPHKTAQDVASDFMRCLYKHIIAKLEKTMTKSMLRETPIHFWFTVPATWTDEAKDATYEAARTAGFEYRASDKLFLITEPEAAAMAILSNSIEKYKGLYKTGTNVLIADLGGGTLDFQCLKLVAFDPLKTDEACKGEGGKAGSTYIDFNLHESLGRIFGDAFRNLPSSKTAPGSAFMDDFEVAKKLFNGKDPNKIFRLRLPALGKELQAEGSSPASFDFDDGDVLITGSDMEKLFNPVVEKAIDLIKNQLKRLKDEKEQPFKVIALCGGLGSSEYIWTRFKAFCDYTLKGEVMLVTDERAWSAVCRGAAVRGLEGPMVLSKKARRAYGIVVHQVFREGIDREEESFTCPIKGKRAPGYMEWHLRRGDKILPKMRKVIKTYVAIEVDDEDLAFTWDLYSCALDIAPSRVDSPGVEKIGKIKLDLTSSFGGSRKAMRTSASSVGSGNQAVEINLVLTMGIERGTLEVTAFHRKTRVGSAKIEYGRDDVRKGARSGGKL